MAMRDRRKLHRYIWSIMVMATFAACGAIVYISFSSETKQVSSIQSSSDFSSSAEKLIEEQCIPVCDSRECVYQSRELFKHMETDVNPCENFFQFLCGKYFENFDPNEYSSFFHRYAHTMMAKLKIVLDGVEADPTSASGKMKTVYDSCMKYSSSDFQAVPIILDFLRRVGIPGWPNLDPDFKFVHASLPRIIANLLSHQEYGFIEFSTKYDYMDLFYSDITLGPDLKLNSSLIAGESSYEKRKKPAREYLVDRILNYFNLDPETISGVLEESEAIHDAILHLKEESFKRVDEYDTPPLLNCTEDTVNEWSDLCRSLELLVEVTNADEKVSKDHAKIRTQLVHFMKNVFHVLGKFSDRSVANYLALNVVLKNLEELNFYFRFSNYKVADSIGEGSQSTLKWTNCVKWISKNMALALGHEYLKSDLTVPLIKDVQDIADEYIRVAADLISLQEWMTEDERTRVKSEVLTTVLQLESVIEILTNETGVNIFYDQFHPTDENYFHSVLEYKKHFKSMEMLGLVSYQETRFIDPLFTVNAGAGGNSIEIQFGILLPTIYTPGLPRFLNLVALQALAHELGHNIDSHFGYEVKESAYLDDKYKCIEDQYSQFRFETIGKTMNGSRYQKENFADNIAISLIDKLVQKYASDNSSSLMPLLPLSLMQQMYINSGHMWCTVHSNESDEKDYNISTHSSERYRLLGMMQNSKGFSEAFGCPDGSFMNPTTKCSFLE